MKLRALSILLCAALIGTAGCAAKTAMPDTTVYSQRGMEISKIASAMADTLYQTMFANLAQQQVEAGNAAAPEYVKKVTMPRVAVTSFVDTDTYEAAGHLGRVLGEIFIHELNRRQINVLEYKLTGNLAVGKKGEYVYSRDYKKLAQTADLSNLLTGTFSRNEDGVVLVARVVNLSDHMVLGTATGFIPYELLPYCYRTYEKGCSLGNVAEYHGKEESKQVAGTKVTAKTDTVSASPSDNGKQKSAAGTSAANPAVAQALPAAASDRIYPPTLSGTYPQYLQEQGEISWFGGPEDPVIYPAHSYLDRNRMVRDVGDESQYQRLDGR